MFLRNGAESAMRNGVAPALDLDTSTTSGRILSIVVAILLLPVAVLVFEGFIRLVPFIGGCLMVGGVLYWLGRWVATGTFDGLIPGFLSFMLGLLLIIFLGE